MDRFLGRLLLAATLYFGAIGGVAASTIQLVNNSYTVSSAGAVSVNRLDLTGAGSLTVTLTDLPWPAPLAQAAFLLSTPTANVLGRYEQFGSESFEISGPEVLYVLAFGQAADFPGLPFGYGSYGLTVNFTPAASSVPLPPASSLLVSALALLSVVWRRRRAPFAAANALARTPDWRAIAINL